MWPCCQGCTFACPQVDDDAGNDPGDDDLDMVDAGQATAVEAGAASRGKSVRMEVAGMVSRCV